MKTFQIEDGFYTDQQPPGRSVIFHLNYAHLLSMVKRKTTRESSQRTLAITAATAAASNTPHYGLHPAFGRMKPSIKGVSIHTNNPKTLRLFLGARGAGGGTASSYTPTLLLNSIARE